MLTKKIHATTGKPDVQGPLTKTYLREPRSRILARLALLAQMESLLAG